MISWRDEPRADHRKNFDLMSLKRNVVANLLGRSYAMGSVYLFVPFYVATLGVEQYGIIAFYAILLTIGSLADVGLSATFSREAARVGGGRDLRDLLATMERVLLGIALLFALAVILGADLIARYWLNGNVTLGSDEIATSLRLMALMIAPQLGISLYTAGLLGLERQASANAMQAAFVTMRGGLIIPLLYWQSSLTLFFSWQLGVTILFFVIARGMLLRGMGFGALGLGRAALSTLRPVIPFASGMFGITLLAAANTQIDKLVVSKMFSIAEFSHYSLASTLAQLPSVVVGPMLVALLPRFTALNEAGKGEEVSRLYDSYNAIIALLSTIGAAGLMLFAGDVLRVWLGRAAHIPPYLETLVRYLACGGLFLSLASTPFYLGLSHGHNRTSMVLNTLVLLVTVPLLLVATARLGLIGAAIPWVVLNAAAFLVLSIAINRRFYVGSITAWLFKFTLLPVLLGVLIVVAARLAANALASTPLIACLVAAGVTSTALLAMGLIARGRLRLS